jgi:hypothetical protein
VSEYRQKVYWADMYLGELTRDEIRAMRDFLNEVLGETYREIEKLRKAIYPELMEMPPPCLLSELIKKHVDERVDDVEGYYNS